MYRLIQAGIIPITWLGAAGELIGDFTNPHITGLEDLLNEYAPFFYDISAFVNGGNQTSTNASSTST